MTMGRVPKFCDRRWSQIQKLSCQNPKNPQKLGIIEPWPECQEIDRRLKQNTTFLIKVSTLLGVYSDYHQKVCLWLEVFVKSSNFTR